VIARCAKDHPQGYLKVCALLVPREMKVEHSQGLKALTDEQLEAAIAYMREMLAAKAGDLTKVIEGQSESVLALPPRGA
jgi:hypothetical protein